MVRDRGRGLIRAADRLFGWTRFAFIFALIVVDGIVEETRILGAEFMMLLRWSRDVIRYDVRWAVQEKLQLVLSRGGAEASRKPRRAPGTPPDKSSAMNGSEQRTKA